MQVMYLLVFTSADFIQKQSKLNPLSEVTFRIRLYTLRTTTPCCAGDWCHFRLRLWLSCRIKAVNRGLHDRGQSLKKGHLPLRKLGAEQPGPGKGTSVSLVRHFSPGKIQLAGIEDRGWHLPRPHCVPVCLSHFQSEKPAFSFKIRNKHCALFLTFPGVSINKCEAGFKLELLGRLRVKWKSVFQ